MTSDSPYLFFLFKTQKCSFLFFSVLKHLYLVFAFLSPKKERDERSPKN
jgi:hypothetical protein